ncbi:MAG TPA: GlsB/YeaQ/YmgE family stress response membrane protein [Candidatus Limnocylindrales bacterium]|nr:GlsB/YeaQ/YmgE family stress response membrane protein [Candidatus Limnocylindrales bacterium]
MDVLGWLVVGFIAGWLSGMVVPGRSARGCLPNILVGVLGAIVGGYLARELRIGDPSGFLGAVVVAFVGAVVVRLAIGLVDGDRSR